MCLNTTHIAVHPYSNFVVIHVQGQSSSTKGGRATAVRDMGRACAEVFYCARPQRLQTSLYHGTGTLAGLIA